MDNTRSQDNLSLIFKAIPEGLPEPGQHLTVEKRPVSINDVPEGGLLARMIYSSLDPYMRMMLIPADQKHYRKPYELGKPLSSYGIAQIVHSKTTDFQNDQFIRGTLAISEYVILSEADLTSGKIEVINSKLPLRMWLGPLGMPGETAYCSLFEIGQPQKGETIFISAASGAVGQLVGQISKNLGLTVIGSVGSQEKLDDIVNNLGFHKGFIYRNEDPNEALSRLCPNGIDIYYDNVGGAQLDAALGHMNKYGRIIVSGMISQYNLPTDQRYGVKNLFQLVGKSVRMQGFQVGDVNMRTKWTSSHRRDVTKWLEEGSIKSTFDETIGIEHGAEAFKAMLTGGNHGKAILRVWLDYDSSTS